MTYPGQEAKASLLESGEVRILGRMPRSSNYTFLVEVVPGENSGAHRDPVLAVYKPSDGERPLWDFPEGLYRREVAAYLLSEGLGWAIVPETVVRCDAPLGAGSLQRFVDADFSVTYFDLLDDAKYRDALVTVATFDILANNADRKAGHLLLDRGGRLWGIDNALTFHPAPKIRTVIWDFAGEEIPQSLLASIQRVAAGDPSIISSISPYLTGAEIGSLVSRAAALAEVGRLPHPLPGEHALPWPLI